MPSAWRSRRPPGDRHGHTWLGRQRVPWTSSVRRSTQGSQCSSDLVVTKGSHSAQHAPADCGNHLRHARGQALTGAEEAAALAELAEVADGRVDLLTDEADLAIGFHEQDADAPVYLQIAQLLCCGTAVHQGERRHSANL